MKNFLLSLNSGVSDKNLEQEEKKLVQTLFKARALELKKGLYFLSPNFFVGRMDVSSRGTGFLEVFDPSYKSKDILIEQSDLNGASRGDFVLVKRDKARGFRAKGRVVTTLKAAHESSIVYIKKVDKRFVGINLRSGLAQILPISQKALKDLPKHAVLLVDNNIGQIVEVLGSLEDPLVDEKIALLHYNKNEFFSKIAEQEALSHGDLVDKSLYPDRLDLTHLPFCTIDPIDAKDFDDAIYFDKENFTLYVAIADVSEYVYPYGQVDKEAKERGFSIYFPHKSIPMLPRSLSENICSLKPNEDRLSFCFIIKIDPKTLEVEKSDLKEVIIKSFKRFNYDEIDAYLEGLSAKNSEDETVLKWLLPLNKTIKRVRKKRLLEGFEFYSVDVRMKLDENSLLTSTRLEKETSSHSLIEDCMLLANICAAKELKKGIFRNHEAPSFEKIINLLNELSLIGIKKSFSPDLNELIASIQDEADSLNIREDVDKLIIKSQKRALYGEYSKGHFGLGFKTYSHFTSPIRRYSDLLLHRLLKAKKDEKLTRFLLQDIEKLCEDLSKLEREADKVAWEFMDRKFARWANGEIGKSFKSIVTDSGKNGIARLDDEIKGARIFLLNENAPLLKRVLVKIVSVDIAMAKIYGRVVEVLN